MTNINNLEKDEEKKGKMLKESETRVKQKPEPKKDPALTFDAYFRILMNEGKAQAHHKAPLKAFMKTKSSLEATKGDFDKIFSTY